MAYGLDFSVLAEHQLSTTEPIMVESQEVTKWPSAKPALLAEVDFMGPFETWLAARVHVEVPFDAQRLGVVLAFRAKLAEGNILSTLPGHVDDANHWAYALFPAFDHGAVKKGETIAIEYAYDRGVTMVTVSAA
jgi:hypothetical protein